MLTRYRINCVTFTQSQTGSCTVNCERVGWRMNLNVCTRSNKTPKKLQHVTFWESSPCRLFGTDKNCTFTPCWKQQTYAKRWFPVIPMFGAYCDHVSLSQTHLFNISATTRASCFVLSADRSPAEGSSALRVTAIQHSTNIWINRYHKIKNNCHQ